MTADASQLSAPLLVTGSTGYIGGRLVPRLLDAGFDVRCLVRAPAKLEMRPWRHHPGVQVIEGDLQSVDDLAGAMHGCKVAYYLVHSMVAAGEAYRQADVELALNFARAAERAGVERIIYLGGLGETGPDLSEHLSSRREVEAALASTGLPVTVLRAAMIIGSGSASFEIMRYLVEHLPVMITPRWVDTRCQPIAVRDALHYLVECVRVPETAGRTMDIGGPDIVTYRELMKEMAAARGLGRRRVVAVPVLTPRLSSLWIHLVTPVSHRIARPLAEGLRNEVICRDDTARQLMPHSPMGVRSAIDLALGRVEAGEVETYWADAGVVPGDPDWAGGTTYEDRREVTVDADGQQTYEAVCRVGGGNGYYAADWLWRARGWIDRVVGGPGLRRGRRDPEQVRFGEALDFWRVTAARPAEHLALRAEMRLPGEALLEFRIEPRDSARSALVQVARFKPRGLAGLLYWYAVLPLHHVVFNGMLRGIKLAAEQGRAAGEQS